MWGMGDVKRVEGIVQGTKRFKYCPSPSFFWGGGGQGGCEQRIKVFVKIQKKILFWGGGGGGRGGGWVGGWGGQGGCEQRIKFFGEN